MQYFFKLKKIFKTYFMLFFTDCNTDEIMHFVMNADFAVLY